VAHDTREGVLGFDIIFSLFLNKNVFVLAIDMLLVPIYGVKFYSFFMICFHESLRITKLVFGRSFVFL
jgi:hypothetical protein